MGKSNSNTNAKNKSRAKPNSKGLANNPNNNNTKPSKSSLQSNKASASASAGRNSNSNTKQQQAKSNKNSSPNKNCNTKNNKMTSSVVATADRPSSSPSSGRDGIIVPPKAKATSTTTVTPTNLVAGSMEGKQIEEPPSSSSTSRGYDKDSRGFPKANRVHRLVHRIGKGRFSEVYSCASKASTATSIDGIGTGPYAIKIVSKNKKRKAHKNGEEGGDVEMTQEEVRIHRRLVHQNIVRCPHAFTDDTSTYLILELCRNELVQHMLLRRESSRLTEPEAKYYLKQLVGALKYLHDERYVVHRDVNPATLLLDKNMQLKLSGFGLARELQATQTNGRSTTIAKGSGGSSAFMAPESIKTKAGRTTCHAPSFEVDVWSVGAVCFTTLVGKSPFATNDAEVTYQRILDNEYDFPDDIDVSEDARDLIGRLLRNDPSDRLSLDEIDLHPFLACDPGQIPKSIPQSATHGRPEWRISKKGVIYAANSASKSPYCVPNISKNTGELQFHSLESFPQPTSEEEPIEPEEVNVDEEGNNASSNNLTPEGQARAAFFAKERAHQQLYTKAMIEWGVAEYARRQTQKQRRANNDQFSRAFVDPEEIKEDSRFMDLLTKKCEQAYKSLYGHRTGGIVKIVDNVDPNVLGKHGKIIAVDEDPNDSEKISFKIEIQEKRVDGTIAYATALPSDIEMRNKGDGGPPKKSRKKRKKGGNESFAFKFVPPSEYAIDLKPVYDLAIVVTCPELDKVTSPLAGMSCVLNDVMAKRNGEGVNDFVQLPSFEEVEVDLLAGETGHSPDHLTKSLSLQPILRSKDFHFLKSFAVICIAGTGIMALRKARHRGNKKDSVRANEQLRNDNICQPSIGQPNSRSDVERKSEANDITMESTDRSGHEASASPEAVTQQHQPNEQQQPQPIDVDALFITKCLLFPDQFFTIASYLPIGESLLGLLLSVGRNDEHDIRSLYRRSRLCGNEYLKEILVTYVNGHGPNESLVVPDADNPHLSAWMEVNPDWQTMFCNMGAKESIRFDTPFSGLIYSGRNSISCNPVPLFTNPAMAVRFGHVGLLRHLVEGEGIDVNTNYPFALSTEEIASDAIEPDERQHLLEIAMFFGQNRIFSYLIGIDGIDLNLEAAFSVYGDRVILRNLPLYVAPYVGPNRALAFLRDLLRLPSFGDDERIPDEDGNIEFTPLSFAILRIIEDTPLISMPFGLDVIRTFISAGARTHRPPGDVNQAVQYPYDIVTSNWHRNGRRKRRGNKILKLLEASLASTKINALIRGFLVRDAIKRQKFHSLLRHILDANLEDRTSHATTKASLSGLLDEYFPLWERWYSKVSTEDALAPLLCKDEAGKCSFDVATVLANPTFALYFGDVHLMEWAVESRGLSWDGLYYWEDRVPQHLLSYAMSFLTELSINDCYLALLDKSNLQSLACKRCSLFYYALLKTANTPCSTSFRCIFDFLNRSDSDVLNLVDDNGQTPLSWVLFFADPAYKCTSSRPITLSNCLRTANILVEAGADCFRGRNKFGENPYQTIEYLSIASSEEDAKKFSHTLSLMQKPHATRINSLIRGHLVRLRSRKARAATLLGAFVRGHQLRRRLWYCQNLSRYGLIAYSDPRGQAANNIVATHDAVVGKVRQARRMMVAARQTVAIAFAAAHDDLVAIRLWAARRPMAILFAAFYLLMSSVSTAVIASYFALLSCLHHGPAHEIHLLIVANAPSFMLPLLERPSQEPKETHEVDLPHCFIILYLSAYLIFVAMPFDWYAHRYLPLHQLRLNWSYVTYAIPFIVAFLPCILTLYGWYHMQRNVDSMRPVLISLADVLMPGPLQETNHEYLYCFRQYVHAKVVLFISNFHPAS